MEMGLSDETDLDVVTFKPSDVVLIKAVSKQTIRIDLAQDHIRILYNIEMVMVIETVTVMAKGMVLVSILVCSKP